MVSELVLGVVDRGFEPSLMLCAYSGEATNKNFIDLGSNPRSTTPKTSSLTITPPMRYFEPEVNFSEIQNIIYDSS
jgi:hypothetical protein